MPEALSVRLYLQVENVDAIYEQLVARNIPTSAPETQWYGLREFSVRDPDGYHWILNHPVPEDQRPPAPAWPTAGARLSGVVSLPSAVWPPVSVTRLIGGSLNGTFHLKFSAV